MLPALVHVLYLSNCNIPILFPEYKTHTVQNSLNVQLALAAERAKSFVKALITFPAVQECFVKEEKIWEIIQESAMLIGQHGMSEDRHLCLFAGGWIGLLRFSKQRLLSEEAELSCMEYVTSLMSKISIPMTMTMAITEDSSQGDEDAFLLNNSLIYDYPQLFPQTEIVTDNIYLRH